MTNEEILLKRYKTIFPHYTPNPYTSKQQREKEIEGKIKELNQIINDNSKKVR